MSDVSKLNINLEHPHPTLHDGLGIIANTKEAIDHSVWRSLAILRTLSNFIKAYHTLTLAKAQAQKNPEL